MGKLKPRNIKRLELRLYIRLSFAKNGFVSQAFLVQSNMPAGLPVSKLQVWMTTTGHPFAVAKGLLRLFEFKWNIFKTCKSRFSFISNLDHFSQYSFSGRRGKPGWECWSSWDTLLTLRAQAVSTQMPVCVPRFHPGYHPAAASWFPPLWWP